MKQAYTRARELCKRVGETPHLAPTLFGLWSVHNARGEYKEAHVTIQQLLTLAERVEDSGLILEGHLATAFTLFWLGEFTSARDHCETGIGRYDPQRHRKHVALYRRDPGMAVHATAAWASWYLGYPDQARELIHQSITLAEECRHPFSLAWALTFDGWIQQFHGQREAVQKRADAVIALATEQGFRVWLAWGTVFRGWAMAVHGQTGEGIAQIRQGLADYRATGAEMGRSYILAVLTEAHRAAGQPKEALATVDEALVFVNQAAECNFETELYRLKGELTLQSRAAGQQSKIEKEAEACFHKALDVARGQQAKSWELRAATSLARLWQQRDKQAEAHQLLAEIYAWFTEGFDTKDLQEAKVLLEELR